MLAITVMTSIQIHSRRGLSRGSLANLYFAHSELRNLRIGWTIHGSSRKARIHASRRAIHGLRKSMLFPQHIHVQLYMYINSMLGNFCTTCKYYTVYLSLPGRIPRTCFEIFSSRGEHLSLHVYMYMFQCTVVVRCTCICTCTCASVIDCVSMVTDCSCLVTMWRRLHTRL